MYQGRLTYALDQTFESVELYRPIMTFFPVVLFVVVAVTEWVSDVLCIHSVMLRLLDSTHACQDSTDEREDFKSGGGMFAAKIAAKTRLAPSPMRVWWRSTLASPEQEGRRDSFSMAVDLLSRLEKRPLDSSLAASSACTASPPLPPLPTTTTGTSLWSSSSACPPPSKSAKFDASATITDTAASTFFVPIAANDLQLLTEPSMANYVTDAATEDQLVREQYSPTQQSVLFVYFSPFLRLLSVLCSTLCRAGPLAVGEMKALNNQHFGGRTETITPGILGPLCVRDGQPPRTPTLINSLGWARCLPNSRGGSLIDVATCVALLCFALPRLAISC
ncbi:hypothetical protein EGR_10511 [Echinococcus granulosus]|uniref:Uncharacterized protein n=1 Tax=Echinococcus granulosus TaxID=6210 RepID=W6U0S4_ECHGR|nr:hypothetical protein EGR_10511 [Echinococcus granulosus]EUB54638.1 hypothetical protein EGR_10511 [Echinococcus granulosus]